MFSFLRKSNLTRRAQKSQPKTKFAPLKKEGYWLQNPHLKMEAIIPRNPRRRGTLEALFAASCALCL